MNKAEELIACLEGEIAKRDETIARLEPQLNRAIQANYDLRAELDEINAQGVRFCNKCGYHGPMETHNRPGDGVVCDYMSRAYAAPVAKPQAVMPKRIQIAGHLSAVEAYRASGWNQCLDEVARLNASPVQQVSVPDGYVLVPQRMELAPADIASIMFHCGGDEEATEVDEMFVGGVLWVGDIKDDDDNLVHGLHIATADYPEEGSTTLVEFAAAPAAPAADAGDVLEQAMYTLISIGYHENSGLVHELRQALAARRVQVVL